MTTKMKDRTESEYRIRTTRPRGSACSDCGEQGRLTALGFCSDCDPFAAYAA